MNARFVLWLAALVVGAAVLAEVLLRPPNAYERTHLWVILGAPAAATAALVPLLRRWVSRRASVAGAALMVGLCSLALGAATTSAASNAMFVSNHDFRLFLVVLLLSCGIALAVGVQLSAPLARDIARLGHVAEAVAGGDLAVRTEIVRNDEVGRAAAAVDAMVVSLRAGAEERQRLTEARQLLFTSVGHDLRTPLAAMRAAVESLQDGVARDPDRYLGLIGSELRSVEALLDQMTAFARIESGAPVGPREQVSVAEVAHEAVEALGPLADRRHVSLRVVANGPCTVLATSLDIARCLRNLVENAVTHSPDHGEVTVTVTVADDGVEVQVLDEGPGFPAEFRDQAFEPFTRADPARTSRTGHAGLGLAITRALAVQHGGRAWLGTAAGGDVRLWFPAGGPR